MQSVGRKIENRQKEGVSLLIKFIIDGGKPDVIVNLKFTVLTTATITERPFFISKEKTKLPQAQSCCYGS